MATKKKVAKAAANKPASKSKFKKKGSDGNGRRGRKLKGTLVETNRLIDLIMKGIAPRVVPAVLQGMFDKTSPDVKKKLTLYMLGKLDEKTRNLIVKRYCPGMTAEQKELMKKGRRLDKMIEDLRGNKK